MEEVIKRRKTSDYKTILSIDLATRTGWALYIHNRVMRGVKQFSKERNERSQQIQDWVFDKLSHYRPDVIVVEKYFIGDNTFKAGIILKQMHAALMLGISKYECTYNKIVDFIYITPLEAKEHTAHTYKHDKTMIIDAVNRMGYQVTDDNEADAISILHTFADKAHIKIAHS